MGGSELDLGLGVPAEASVGPTDLDIAVGPAGFSGVAVFDVDGPLDLGLAGVGSRPDVELDEPPALAPVPGGVDPDP